MNPRWFKTALINLLLAASMGTLLRFAFVEEVAWMKYKNILHAHSHVAMLGWVYLALYNLLLHAFLPPATLERPLYRRLFWLTQLSVAGMFVSFPIQGYAGFSIAFSTLHVLVSYVFVWQFWRDLNRGDEKAAFSALLAKTALAFMVVSTISLWLLGPIIMTDLKRTALYYMCVQFFLHFQFNGWFLLGVLALFFKRFEGHGIHFNRNSQRLFYGLVMVSTLSTYALAVAWSNPKPIVFWVNSIGVLVQLAAIIVLVALYRPHARQISALLAPWEKGLFAMAAVGLLLKVAVQTAVAIPQIATIAYTIRNYVIGFIHLVLLGVISSFILALAIEKGVIPVRRSLARAGIVFFVAGFLLSELLLFLQGTLLWAQIGFMPRYYELLFGASLLIPIGIILLLLPRTER
jgi:hypothetical protein